MKIQCFQDRFKAGPCPDLAGCPVQTYLGSHEGHGSLHVLKFAESCGVARKSSSCPEISNPYSPAGGVQQNIATCNIPAKREREEDL